MAAFRKQQQTDASFDQDLKRRKAKERKEDLRKEHGKTYLFHLDMVDSATKSSIDELNGLLTKMGVHFELSDQHFQGYEYHYLEITVREENVRNIQTRHAGRTQNPVLFRDTATGRETRATVNKVEQLIATNGAMGAAAILGMSKAGMYRRLGRARAAGIPCDRSCEPLGEEDIQF